MKDNNILSQIENNLKNSRVSCPKSLENKVISACLDTKADRLVIKNPFIFKRFLTPAVTFALGLFLAYGIFSFKGAVNSEQKVKVVFVMYRPDAKSVRLAGDFNSWGASNGHLYNKNGYWMKEVELPPGQYEYVFVVDEKEWLPDPTNEQYAMSSYGGINSVIEISAEEI